MLAGCSIAEEVEIEGHIQDYKLVLQEELYRNNTTVLIHCKHVASYIYMHINYTCMYNMQP